MEFTRPRGTRDFLFEEMRKRKQAEGTLRKIFESYGYQEIKTPLFEELSLFTTKSGEEIVNQLYNFKDKSDRELTLRPEITAPVARLYLNDPSRPTSSQKCGRKLIFDNRIRKINVKIDVLSRKRTDI